MLEQAKISKDINENIQYFKKKLGIGMNFDVLYRTIKIGGRDAIFFFVDGFCKDEMMQKMLQYFLDIKEDEMPPDAWGMLKEKMPYVEADLSDDKQKIETMILSGVFVLMIDGYDKAILIDSRTYPARDVGEPEKDKALRGSKDGFVETIVFNTALIRRRIRSTDLCMEMCSAGDTSHTDIVLCYMNSRVDKKLLTKIRTRIKELQVDALTMNQESLAECLYHHSWINPFPKFRFTERPDTASAQILEGNIVVLVDNSPSAMIFPASIFDLMEDADDYYFPPITGTYLRLTRWIIAVFTFLLTPTYLLLTEHPEWVPDTFAFIHLKEAANISVFWQFLILELAIDGLRLAAVHTPSMLSTPLSVMAGLVLGEFSVQSGWFNAEVILYMAFVAIANYTQSNYELDYAMKFMRILTLILTVLFDLPGYIIGVAVTILALVTNKTFAGRRYLYPLIPLDIRALKRRLTRRRLRSREDAGGAGR